MTSAYGLQSAVLFAQANLDQDLSSARLSQIAEISPDHFRRRFRQELGETPAQFVERLRLEKAAFRLTVSDESVLSIALDCGYANHETFTRAFKRRFQLTPRAYQRAGRFRQRACPPAERSRENATPYEVSRTQITRLKPLQVAFIRHTGPYENVPTSLWQKLQNYVRETRGDEGGMLLGVGHDSLAITPIDKLRFDACMTVDGSVLGDGDIRIGALPSLTCGATTFVGPYAALPDVYPLIFSKVSALPNHALVGLPVIEIYRDNTVELTRSASVTEILIPVKRKPMRG